MRRISGTPRRSLPALAVGALAASLVVGAAAPAAVAAPATADWTQTDWSGGAGQSTWSDPTKYQSGTSVDTSGAGQVRLSSTSVVYSDSFTTAGAFDPWSTYNPGSWAVDAGALTGTATDGYSNAYYIPAAPTDYTVEARVRMPATSIGGGVGGRLTPTTGERYSVWLYPPSGGASNAGNIVLNKFLEDTTDWSTYTELLKVPFTVGTDWHDVKVEFAGSRIRVWMDGAATPTINYPPNPGDPGYDTYVPDTTPLTGGGGIVFDTYNDAAHAGSLSVDSVSMSVAPVYSSTGSLVSSAFDAGAGSTWQALKWTATTPAGTSVRLRTRTADTSAGLAASTWSAWTSTSGAAIAGASGRWLQYEAELATSDTSTTPVLDDVTATYVLPDTVAPVVTVPGNTTVQAVASSGAAFTYTASAVDDVDGALTPTCSPVSGSTFPVGVTTVTCSATDKAGNPASKAFTITVLAPVVTPPPPALPTPDVRIKAVSGKSKLKVDVNPNQGKKYWTFQVQKKNADGSWTLLRTYKTKGSKETRTVNLRKGTYRVWVNPKFGYQGVTTATEVTLKR